eukprot:Lankesteria_metandrocarpae@DN11015_c0_g1_i1.p2
MLSADCEERRAASEHRRILYTYATLQKVLVKSAVVPAKSHGVSPSSYQPSSGSLTATDRSIDTPLLEEIEVNYFGKTETERVSLFKDVVEQLQNSAHTREQLEAQIAKLELSAKRSTGSREEAEWNR